MNRPALPRRHTVARRGARLAQPARAGATLTEVLMSLLIMGLGITSVFTLFPMSILRSIKSTNLTHAALLADTARDFYLYRKNTLTAPPVKSTASYYSHPQDFLLIGNVADADIPEPFVGTFVVDPLGGANAGPYGRNPGKYGEVLRIVNQTPAPTAMTEVYYDLYTSHDSWVTVYDEVPESVVNLPVPLVTQFRFPSTIDMSGDLIAPPAVATTARTYEPSRVVAFSFNGKKSVTRNVFSTPTGGTGNLVNVSPQIPASSFPGGLADIGRVHVQNFERRYSYLMTMHRDELGSTRAQVVVFFRREFGESEAVAVVEPNLPNDRTQIDKRNRKLTVNIPAGTTRSPSPGDYVFGTWRAKPAGNPGYNVVRGRWYRVVSVSALNATQYRLTLDRAWEGLTDAGNEPRLMLPSGVISVFDL